MGMVVDWELRISRGNNPTCCGIRVALRYQNDTVNRYRLSQGDGSTNYGLETWSQLYVAHDTA